MNKTKHSELELLKVENEELKNNNTELKKYIKGFVSNCKYCDEWYMDKCLYMKKENKYKQALEEVRELAYTTDFDIRDIQKIVNEVLKYETVTKRKKWKKKS